jgi:hypothetical protein
LHDRKLQDVAEQFGDRCEVSARLLGVNLKAGFTEEDKEIVISAVKRRCLEDVEGLGRGAGVVIVANRPGGSISVLIHWAHPHNVLQHPNVDTAQLKETVGFHEHTVPVQVPWPSQTIEDQCNAYTGLLKADRIIVDEGHLVFSHQPESWLDGQHLLPASHVKTVIKALSKPSTSLIVFHDQSYQHAGDTPVYPGTKHTKFRLPICRNPPAVRDISVPFCEELQASPCLHRSSAEQLSEFYTPHHLPTAPFFPLEKQQLKGPHNPAVKLFEVERCKAVPLHGLSPDQIEGTAKGCANDPALVRVMNDAYAKQIVACLEEIISNFLGEDGSNVHDLPSQIAVIFPGAYDVAQGILRSMRSCELSSAVSRMLDGTVVHEYLPEAMYVGAAENTAAALRAKNNARLAAKK